MNNPQILNQSQWDCKYHVVFISKYRRKVFSEKSAFNGVKFFVNLRPTKSV